jgi:outer membrane lipoprotein-sorting protein
MIVPQLFVVLAAAAAAPAPAPRHDPDAFAALVAMEHATAGIRDYTMRLVTRELRGTELSPEETIDIKWQRPQRIYLHEVAGPREGQEVLYAPGWNKGRIRVHKGSFPDWNVNLDPYGATAMAHSHHPVPEISLVHLTEIVLDNLRRARGRNVGSLSLRGHEAVFGRPAMKLEARTPATGRSPTLAKGQTLWDLAKATGQSMYVILHANRVRKWRQADHPEPGDAVIVPEFYAGRLVLWIDDELHLPLQIDLYDHEGNLYEHYEHHDLKINVGLTDSDFDPANPAYRF